MESEPEFRTERILTQESVSAALDAHGADHPETLALLRAFEDALPGRRDEAHVHTLDGIRADIVCAVAMAHVYLGTQRYQAEGVRALDDALLLASQNDAHADMIENIKAAYPHNV